MKITLSLLLVLTCSVISLTAASPGKAPSITKEPDSLSAGYGGTVKLSVTAQGTETLSFQWFKDGVVLNNDLLTVAGANTESLSLGPVKPINSGEYFAVISNSFGSVTSQVARLSLLQDVAVKIAGTCPSYGSGCANGVAVSGSYAFVADGVSGLQVVDISNPTNSVQVGRLGTSGYALGVAVNGNYAYVADSDAGLQVIDISNPVNPQRIGGCAAGAYALGVVTVGTTAYVASGNDGLIVIDISNPANPKRIGSL